MDVGVLKKFLENCTGWQDPGAPASTTAADTQTQVDQDLKTHRLQLENEEK